MDNFSQHSLSLENRERLTIKGVNDVDEFNEQLITAVCDSDELTIKGEHMHIEELSIETKTLIVSGKIISLTYSQKISGNSVFKRLFGG